MDDAWARQSLIDAALALQHEGLCPQRSGNLSLRSAHGMLITPSGMAYDDLLPEDIVEMTCDGAVPQGARKPSSEWRLHGEIYRTRAEVTAVVHCHSPFATALACTRRDVPAFHYMVAAAGGRDIRCAAYATFGSSELAASVLAALEGRRACLMANHGQLAVGGDLAGALDLAREVETLCAQYARALQAGSPVLLDDAEMERVLALFAGYGQGRS